MTTRTARGGGTTVRWVYGAFIALCAALAVLVHHETAAMGATPMPGASSTAHAASMSGMDPSSMTGAVHAGHVMPDEGNPTSWEPSSPNTADTGGCDAPGMQHCSTASLVSVQLAVPGDNGFTPLADLHEAATGRTPASAVGRAPPDLSVLSQLRL